MLRFHLAMRQQHMTNDDGEQSQAQLDSYCTHMTGSMYLLSQTCISCVCDRVCKSVGAYAAGQFSGRPCE